MPFDFERGLVNLTGLDQRVLSGQFWGELRVFLAVAKAGSFNRAAEVLGSSQPTVSRQVKRLQDLVGYQLIATTSQGIALTAEGRHLAAAASDLDERLFAVSNRIGMRKGEVEGVVSVSIRDSLVAAFVAPAIGEFSRLHPGIRIHLRPPLRLVDARCNNADVNVVFHPVSLDEMATRPLGFYHLVPVASTKYVEAFGRPSLETASRHRFVQTPFYLERTGIWDEWLNLCNRGKVVHHSEHPFGYNMLVLAGVGVGLLTNYSSLYATAVPLDLGVHVVMPMHLVVLRERLKARHVEVVCNWLGSLLGPHNPWLQRELRFTEQLERDERP